MGRQVGKVRPLIFRLVGCASCAIGIAVDMVGQVYGDPPSPWCTPGHECALTRRGGVSEDVDRQLVEIREGIRPMQPQQAPLHGVG